MQQEKSSSNPQHNLILENRNKLSLTGVKDVEAFDEKLITLLTNMGKLTIHGEMLHINLLSLETGELIIDGNISALVYSREESKKGRANILSRIFR